MIIFEYFIDQFALIFASFLKKCTLNFEDTILTNGYLTIDRDNRLYQAPPPAPTYSSLPILLLFSSQMFSASKMLVLKIFSKKKKNFTISASFEKCGNDANMSLATCQM